MAVEINPITLSGTVCAFSGNGRRLGYPTANMNLDTSLADGVYLGFANLNGFHNNPALIFIGTPTTVGDTARRVEAHLLDIDDRDYYRMELTLVVTYFLRPNQTFDSVDELVVAMHQDEAAARQWFSEKSILGAKA